MGDGETEHKTRDDEKAPARPSTEESRQKSSDSAHEPGPRRRRWQGGVVDGQGTLIRSLIEASLASPMPGTSSRSSTTSNAPFASR
jgi:hypothetical protein